MSGSTEYNSLIGKINKMLTPTKRLYANSEGSKFTIRTIGGSDIGKDLTRTETYYILHGMYEGIKLTKKAKPKK